MHVKMNIVTPPMQQKLTRKGIHIIFILATAQPVQYQLRARGRGQQAGHIPQYSSIWCGSK